MMHDASTQMMHELMHWGVQILTILKKLTQKIKFYEKSPIFEEYKP